jgi:hypothetical protein
LSIRSTSVASHVEHNILQAGSLSNLPMNTSTSGDWHSGGVKNKVADLSEEVVLFDD